MMVAYSVSVGGKLRRLNYKAKTVEETVQQVLCSTNAGWKVLNQTDNFAWLGLNDKYRILIGSL